jgi:hypothetical protein
MHNHLAQDVDSLTRFARLWVVLRYLCAGGRAAASWSRRYVKKLSQCPHSCGRIVLHSTWLENSTSTRTRTSIARMGAVCQHLLVFEGTAAEDAPPSIAPFIHSAHVPTTARVLPP